MKTYEVILNGPAHGLAAGENIKLIEADRFTQDDTTGRTSFFVGDELVAQFVNVHGVSVAS